MSSYQSPEDSTPDLLPATTSEMPHETAEQTLIIDEPTMVDGLAGSNTEPVNTPAAEPVTAQSPRMRTVVFGLVLLVIAGCVLVGELTDVTVDAGAVVLALMIGGGLLLIAGARRS